MLGHNHPSIVIPQNTEYAKEMRKHEAHHGTFGAPGRPYTFQEYPKRLSRAEYVPGKGTVIVDAYTVQNEAEERNMQSRGFYFGHEAAIAAVERQHTEFGKLAAEREFEIQHNRLSERAVAEVRAAEAEHGSQHLPVVPETPIKKRGRPAKVVSPV